MKKISLLGILFLLFLSACEKEKNPIDPNRPQVIEIGDDKIKNISELVFQKSSFSNSGVLFILGEGLNYNKDLFSIEGEGDYLQINITIEPGNQITSGLYRFSQNFGLPKTINFGQLAEDYIQGNCFCTNLTDALMEVNELEGENHYLIDLIGKNNFGTEIRAYYNGAVTLQIF
jgi:hypothetical protein